MSSWRLRLLSALTILLVMCLLVVGAAQAQSATGYDDDNEGLIEIDSLPLVARWGGHLMLLSLARTLMDGS